MRALKVTKWCPIVQRDSEQRLTRPKPDTACGQGTPSSTSNLRSHIWPLRLGDRVHFVSRWMVTEAVGQPNGVADALVVIGEYVQPTKGEIQEHLSGPPTDPFHGHELLDDGLVPELAMPVQGKLSAVDRAVREMIRDRPKLIV